MIEITQIDKIVDLTVNPQTEVINIEVTEKLKPVFIVAENEPVAVVTAQNLQTTTDGPGNNSTTNTIIQGDVSTGNYIEIDALSGSITIFNGFIPLAVYNSSQILISDGVGGFLTISNNEIVTPNGNYPLPTGASSPIATLLDILSSASSSEAYATNAVSFKNTIGDYFGKVTAPRTGTLTFDTTDAVTGGIAIVYYNNSTLAIPSVWRTIGTFVPNELNKIYLERDSEGYITCNIVSIPTEIVTTPFGVTGLTLTEETFSIVIPAPNGVTGLTLTEEII